MTLLGVDLETTGCKAAAYYREHYARYEQLLAAVRPTLARWRQEPDQPGVP